MNKFGLSRHIPAEIALIVRQNSGFGCVICGCGIYEYEHIEPEYSEAKVHDPNCMTLLCPNCHTKVTKGIITKDRVWQAKNNPKALEKGFSSDWFEMGEISPDVVFAGSIFRKCSDLIKIKGVSIISFSPSSQEYSPCLISGNFYNRNGFKTLEIINNEWKSFITNWDMNIIGKTLTILEDRKKIALKLRLDPPNKFIIEEINMHYRGIPIQGNAKYLKIGNGYIEGVTFIGSENCIRID